MESNNIRYQFYGVTKNQQITKRMIIKNLSKLQKIDYKIIDDEDKVNYAVKYKKESSEVN